MDDFLDELFGLVQKEHEGDLTPEENHRYKYLVETLWENDIEIPFGIEY